MLTSFQKLISIGIHNAPKKEHKRIKTLNVLCFTISIVYFIEIVKNLVTNNLLFSHFFWFDIVLLNLAGFIIYLQHKLYIQTARLLFVIICLLVACISCLFEPGTLAEQNFIIIPIISLALLNNKWLNISILIICFFLHYFFFTTIIAYDNVNYNTFNTIAYIICGFIILMNTQNLNKKQEALLEKQRDNAFLDKVKLEKQETELRKLNEFKSHFFVNLSHEIRTPITLIKGYSNNMNLDESKATNQEKLQVINNQVNEIEGILNSIMDLSKLDANKLIINRENYSINSLLNKLYGDYKSLFDKKKYYFFITIFYY